MERPFVDLILKWEAIKVTILIICTENPLRKGRQRVNILIT